MLNISCRVTYNIQQSRRLFVFLCGARCSASLRTCVGKIRVIIRMVLLEQASDGAGRVFSLCITYELRSETNKRKTVGVNSHGQLAIEAFLRSMIRRCIAASIHLFSRSLFVRHENRKIVGWELYIIISSRW